MLIDSNFMCRTYRRRTVSSSVPGEISIAGVWLESVILVPFLLSIDFIILHKPFDLDFSFFKDENVLCTRQHVSLSFAMSNANLNCYR